MTETQIQPQMTAIIQSELGGPEVLHPETVAVPTPRVGEIQIRVEAAGINPIDVMHRQAGMFFGQPPFGVGWDVAGTVTDVAPGVTVHRVGDRVFGMLPFPYAMGAYAEYVTGPARAFVPIPDGVSAVDAAAVPLAGITAYQALFDTAHLVEGHVLAVNGAAGAVGRQAVAMAARAGAEVYAIARGAVTADELGSHHLLDPESGPVAGRLPEVDIALDVLGGQPALDLLESVRPGGILVTTLPQTLAILAEPASQRDVRIAALLVESDHQAMGRVASLLSDGLRLPVAATFPLVEAAAAHSALAAGTARSGKVVLVVDNAA